MTERQTVAGRRDGDSEAAETGKRDVAVETVRIAGAVKRGVAGRIAERTVKRDGAGSTGMTGESVGRTVKRDGAGSTGMTGESVTEAGKREAAVRKKAAAGTAETVRDAV